MTISIGDRVPAATLKKMGASGPEELSTGDFFAGRKVVLFAVPGAFTPTCSNKHLPGFVEHAGQIKAKGVDIIACMSVNDAFVMDAWGKDHNVGEKILMVGDPFLNFIRAIGAEVDKSARGLGLRSNRFTMLVDKLKIVTLQEEEDTGLCEVSAAKNFIKLV